MRDRPQPRQVRDWKAAEHLAADWMRYLGFPDAHVTQDGADGGIDVRARQALAQVKFKASTVGGPDLQRLFGARGTATEKALLFFTGTGYSTKAMDYASETGIALFIFDWVGNVEAANTTARRMLRDAAEPPPESAAAPAAGGPPRRDPMSPGYLTGRPQPGPAPSSEPVDRWEQISDFTDRAITPNNLKIGVGGLVAMAFGGAGTMLGVADFVNKPEDRVPATIFGIVGVVIYLVAVAVLGGEVSEIRARSRNWASVAVLVLGGIAATFFFVGAGSQQSDYDHPSGPEAFIVASVLILPFVILLIASRRNGTADR